MIDIWAALRRVVTALEASEIPYMVVGGIANLAWGEPRTTQDVDLTVDIESVGLEDFLEIAKGVGTPLADDPKDVAERGRLIPIRTPQGVRVDLMVATYPFELDAIAQAVSVPIEGVEVRVCPPEHLLLMKIVSSRTQDHLDVVGVLRRRGAGLDLPRLDTAIEGLAHDLAEPEIAQRWQEAKAAAGFATR